MTATQSGRSMVPGVLVRCRWVYLLTRNPPDVSLRGRIERFLQDSAGVVNSCFGVGRCTAPWSRGLHSVRIAGRGDPEVVEGQWLAVLAVSVVIFRDDMRLFPYSARAPGRCDASARDADQFGGPPRVLLVNGIARYWGSVD